jgi:hypothetical protein
MPTEIHLRAGLSFLAVMVLVCISSAVARADSFSVVGNSNSTATATLNITTLTNGELCFTLTNTSPGVITGVGFDLPGSGSFALESITGGSGTFTFSTNAGNVPQFNNAVLDFAFVTHSDNFAGGNPPSGVPSGQTSPLFCVTGNFTGLSQQQIANAVFVRFQSLPTGEGSDVGTVTTVIPEPTSMFLLGSGLLGLAYGLRHRRNWK